MVMGAPRLESHSPLCHYGRLAVRPEIALMIVVVIVTAKFVLHGSRCPSWLFGPTAPDDAPKDPPKGPHRLVPGVTF